MKPKKIIKISQTIIKKIITNINPLYKYFKIKLNITLPL